MKRDSSRPALALAVAAALVVEVAGITSGQGASGFLQWLREHLRLQRSVLASVVRGAELARPPLAIWLSNRDGTNAHSIAATSDYRSPIFSPDERKVAVLHGTALDILSLSGKVLAATPIALEQVDVSTLALLGWDHADLVAIDGSGELVAICSTDGTGRIIGKLSPPDAAEARAGSRTCGGEQIYHGSRERGGPDPSSDRIRLFKVKDPARGGRELPISVDLQVALDPAFSQSCRTIVFLGATSW
jgi:hypothetical protein